MRDRPSGQELAAVADALGAGDALAARCHAVAARERGAGEGGFAAPRAALVARYGAGEDGWLLARLANDISAGALDDGGADREALAAILRAITQQKLRESNPDYRGGTTPR
jgi:hypothetical protein